MSLNFINKRSDITPLKLQLCTEDNIGNVIFKDFYFNVEKISGWYVPNYDSVDDPVINLFFEGDTVSVKQERHLMEYLVDKFVDVK